MFLGIYMLWVPFWPARIVHIIYLLYHLLFLYILKRRSIFFVKISIMLTYLLQLFLATFFWFPLETRFELFYFLLPMGCFAIMNLLKPKERIIALLVSTASFILFFLNSYLDMNYYLFEVDELAIKIISFVTITSTMGILGIYFYLHSFF